MANSNGWGDGAANNDIGWGQGANNAIGWGSSHSASWSGLTDIVGISAASLLLDTYTGAAVAYSLRQLRTAYTGAAIRVRRSSDNAEQDINFVGGDLDTSSLLSFVGAGNGFITTWYDQSGNANNSTQATATSQAQIVSSGALILSTFTSKITTTWTDDRYDLTTGISPNTRYLSLNVVNRTATSNDFYSLGTATFGGGVNSQSPFVWFATTGNINSYMPTALTHGTNNTTGAFIVTSEKNASNLKTIYVDGVALATTATEAPSAGNNFIYFGRSGNNFITGQLSEYIYWNSEQSANRTGIETNVNTYWNAY